MILITIWRTNPKHISNSDLNAHLLSHCPLGWRGETLSSVTDSRPNLPFLPFKCKCCLSQWAAGKNTEPRELSLKSPVAPFSVCNPFPTLFVLCWKYTLLSPWCHPLLNPQPLTINSQTGFAQTVPPPPVQLEWYFKVQYNRSSTYISLHDQWISKTE